MLSLGEVLLKKGEEEPARQLRKEAIQRWKAQEKPDPEFALSLNSLALDERNAGEFAEAEDLLQAALEVEKEAYPEGHPKLPHRMGNLCFVMILRGDLEQGKRLNREALQLNGMCGDVTTGRLLFMQLVLSLLTKRESLESVRNLRNHVAQDKIEAQADIATEWKISKPLKHLEPKLSSEQFEFLQTLADVLNDTSQRSKLDRFDIWKRVSATDRV